MESRSFNKQNAMNGLKANRMKLRRYQRLKDWTVSPLSVSFMLRIECITCSDSRKIWYLLFANAAVWEVGLKEMKVSRIEPEQTEDVDPLASSTFCVDIPRGILRANELESAPGRKWVLLNRCFDLYNTKPLPDHKSSKPRKHLFSVRAAKVVSQTVRIKLPEPQRRKNPMRWIH